MVEVDGLNMTMSQGDDLNVVLDLGDYELQASDKVRFSLMPVCGSAPAVSAAATGITGNKLYIKIPSAMTRKFQPGGFLYDITVCNAVGVKTANFPAAIRVVCTAHTMKDLPSGGSGPPSISGGADIPEEEAPRISIDMPPGWEDMEAAVQKAKDWAMGEDSPDGGNDEDSPTQRTMSAKQWALYAKETVLHAVAPATAEQIDSAIGGNDDSE